MMQNKSNPPTTETYKHMSNINSITVGYGRGYEATIDVPEGATIEEALAAAKGALGFGANVEAHIDGVPQPGDAPVVAGDKLEVHDKACSKAA